MKERGRLGVLAALAVGTLLSLPASPALAGDWGVRLGGDIGGAPDFAAKSWFGATKTAFQWRSSGTELSAVYKSFDFGFFMQTVNKGNLDYGYVDRSCGTWTGELVCLPQGTYIAPAGARLMGVKMGGFLTLGRPNGWLRIGVPLHIAAAFAAKKAKQVDSEIIVTPVSATTAQVTQKLTVTDVGTDQIFKGGLSPYPIVDIGLGVRIRTSSWSELEVAVKAENPRLPVLAWAMVFQKNR